MSDEQIHLGFKEMREDWNEYQLSDGTSLFVKTVVVDVMRGGHQPDGLPNYGVKTQIIVKVTGVPKELIKKVDGQGTSKPSMMNM